MGLGDGLRENRAAPGHQAVFPGYRCSFFFFSCLTFFFRFAKMIHVHLEVKKAVHHLLVVTDTQGNPGGNTPLSFIKYGGSRGHREAGLAPGLWGSQEGLM